MSKNRGFDSLAITKFPPIRGVKTIDPKEETKTAPHVRYKPLENKAVSRIILEGRRIGYNLTKDFVPAKKKEPVVTQAPF